MEEGRRSGEHSGVVVKNMSSSGCLIVKKKGDGVGVSGVGSSSGTRKVYESKKEKKRLKMVVSESGSSDELLMPRRRKVGPETIRVCNGLAGYDKGILEETETGRKRNRVEDVRYNEGGSAGNNGEHSSDRKRNKLDVFEFDEYDGIDGELAFRRQRYGDGGVDIGGRRLLGSVTTARRGSDWEYEAGSSGDVIEKRKKMYFDRAGSSGGYKNRFEISRDQSSRPISLLREKHMENSVEPIRLQGKNGVLKVMVNKKKKVAASLNNFEQFEGKKSHSGSKIQGVIRVKTPMRSPIYSETEVIEQPVPFVRTKKKTESFLKTTPKSKGHDDSEDSDSDSSLKLEPKLIETQKSMKRTSAKDEKTPPTRIKDGKVKRGSGTEKQQLREQIRAMLLEAGWTIDYRPRRNRDYLDAVYINPAGTAYWSIIKAYDALQKQSNDEEDAAKASKDNSAFTPIADEVLSQLTRKTRKKIEKEMKRKQREGSDIEIKREGAIRKCSSIRHEEGSMDSDSHEEKLSSFIKQGGKSSKNRLIENGLVSVSSKSNSFLHDMNERPLHGSNSHQLHGRKSKKHGRCTLLVRNSSEGQNSVTGGYVPYSGRRTLLSWLIDSGTVQLSQKVQYMNRRRSRVMLEGWITRDGIHCGCCSKILTVSKFEIHAGSKLRQPYQNICLDSGVSLLQCQMDAWNRQEGSECLDFHSVKVDGDDPNDDTCGICGDGGDLICCDGCPSTFHLSCLDIQMLPPGDWHCSNCTCKICGVVGRDTLQAEDPTVCALLTCSMCEKKYHKSCTREMNEYPTNLIGLSQAFCGQKCLELSEHLQRYLGTKHELEAGFSWSFIHRIDSDLDSSSRALSQRVESNSKLAVALDIMDECFLPIIDRRSGVNLIHNVLYNCGSNFNRLNYSGFYTAILERGDEIISAASIRFHGARLAEMPYIGTRHIYRRQGMCRRLFGAIESALSSMKVEKLVIPAIPEFLHAWTVIFGFTPLEDSIKKELRSMNMLVFPGINMLQKWLTAKTDVRQPELKDGHSITPDVESKPDMDSSSKHEHFELDDTPASKEISQHGGMESGSSLRNVSLDDTSEISCSLDAFKEIQIPTLAEGTASPESKSVNEVTESAEGKNLFFKGTTQNEIQIEKPPRLESHAEENASCKNDNRDNTQLSSDKIVTSHGDNVLVSVVRFASNDSVSEGGLTKSSFDKNNLLLGEDASPKEEFLVEDTTVADTLSGNKIIECASECNRLSSPDGSLNSQNVEDTNNSKEDDMQIAVSVSHEDEDLVESAIFAHTQLGEKLTVSSPDKKCLFVSNRSGITVDKEIGVISDSLYEDKAQLSKEGCSEDSHSTEFGVIPSSGLKIPVPLEVIIETNSQSVDELVEGSSGRRDQGNSQSCKEDDMDSNIECLEPSPSSGRVIITERINEEIEGKKCDDDRQSCKKGEMDNNNNKSLEVVVHSSKNIHVDRNNLKYDDDHQSFKEGNVDKNIACLEAARSSGETAANNFNNEISEISGSIGADLSFDEQISSDDQTKCEETKSHVVFPAWSSGKTAANNFNKEISEISGSIGADLSFDKQISSDDQTKCEETKSHVVTETGSDSDTDIHQEKPECASV